MRLNFAILILLSSGVLLSCGILDDSYDVEYRVTGTARQVDITIQNQDGGTSQFDDVDVPWDYSFKGHPGDFVYVFAQNQGQTGTVIVTINRDGKKFKSSESQGTFVIATASGTL